MYTVTKNGIIVTASETYQADIDMEDGKIVLISQDLRGKQLVDAAGHYVFPSFAQGQVSALQKT